jgi:hypothetical protein
MLHIQTPDMIQIRPAGAARAADIAAKVLANDQAASYGTDYFA